MEVIIGALDQNRGQLPGLPRDRTGREAKGRPCREASLKWPQKVAATVRAATLRPCLQAGQFACSGPLSILTPSRMLVANEIEGDRMKFEVGTETINS